MRIRIQQLKLMRKHADPDPQPWPALVHRIRDPHLVLGVGAPFVSDVYRGVGGRPGPTPNPDPHAATRA
jgi:hypothetical protein